MTNYIIPNESVRALFLEMQFKNELGEHQHLSCGTGFFYKVDSQMFLITARHNLAGRAWRTNQVMSSHGVEPNYLRIHTHAANNIRCVGYWDLPLYTNEDGVEIPRWYEHPICGRDMDVVALPLGNVPTTILALPWEPSPIPKLWVTEELSIVGYPYAFSKHLALWIRGTIASEPGLAYEGFPLFLIDSRTRSGQSGSPVLRYHLPGSTTADSENLQNVRVWPAYSSELVGVYTGRINPLSMDVTPEDKADLQIGGTDLGFVWTASEIKEICRGRKRNPMPPIGKLPKVWDPALFTPITDVDAGAAKMTSPTGAS